MSDLKEQHIADQESVSDQIELQGHILEKGDIDEYLYFDKPWYKYKHFLILHFYVFIISLTSTISGYDGSMLNGLQILEDWNDAMGHPEGAVLGALANGSVFGGIISFIFASWFSDKFGRKTSIYVGQSFTILGAILQGVSTNYTFFIWSRIILGMGFGLSTVSSPTLISELSYPKFRETCTAIYASFWYFGAIIAAWVTFGTQPIPSSYAWRIPSYLQGALPVVQVLIFWLIPESPRFLISKGKEDKARNILMKYHCGNDGTEQAHKLVEFEVKEIKAALELEEICATSSFFDFVKIPTYRKRLFILLFTGVIMQLSGNGLVSYYFTKVLDTIGITDARKQLEINGCLMIYNLIISWIAASICQYFRRRTLFLLCIGGMFISFVIWTILSARFALGGFQDTGLANGVLAMIFLFYGAYDLGANGLPMLYVTEILPYSHRAKGINIFFLANNVIVLFNGFVNPIAMDAIEWKYYIVYCCVLAVELVLVYLLYPETSGYTLEEVAKVFGDDPETSLTHLSSAPQKMVVEQVEHSTDKFV
ncbi:HXT2.4 [[Candida] subhashii]|uniref:HXT2.4 n=1 Tax=[Candida] subhashii TaxID=561895 RepID=A0A8J5QCR2_9ASCO|nr:HXT2.4 [[Candida] subhashii]KAG7660388.1 HXT2.4 [[Candida] subhashii]